MFRLHEVALFLSTVTEETGKRDCRGKTALMRACECPQLTADIVRELCGTEASEVDDNGLSCSDYIEDNALRQLIAERNFLCQ